MRDIGVSGVLFVPVALFFCVLTFTLVIYLIKIILSTLIMAHSYSS